MAPKFFLKYILLIIIIFSDLFLLFSSMFWWKEYFVWYFVIRTIISFLVFVFINDKLQKKDLLVPWFMLSLFLPIVASVVCLKISASKKENDIMIANVPFYPGSAKYYNCGKDFFEDLKKEIKKAKKSIYIEFYIVRQGKLLDEIIDLLKQKVKDGLNVALIYDDFGSILLNNRKFKKEMKQIGIETYCFKKYDLGFSLLKNNRNHRKIVVIDQSIVFTGGVNLADEYVGKIKRFGVWKDSGIKITGCGVYEFLTDFQRLCEVDVESIQEHEKQSTAHIRNVFSGGCRQRAEDEIINLIEEAAYSIDISTPYFMPDQILKYALIRASSRGVKIRFFFPGIADKKIVNLVTKSNYPFLKEIGAEVFEFSSGFIHSKNILIDNSTMMVGSVNLDFRSLNHHYECGVIVKNAAAVNSLKKDFEELKIKCKLIESKNIKNNSFFIKILKIIEPLM